MTLLDHRLTGPAAREHSRARGWWLALSTTPLGPVLVAVADAIWCTGVAIADPTRANNSLPQCPFHALTGLDCPGCGSTRMTYELLHGHLGEAAHYNIVALALVPALAITWLDWSWRAVTGRRLVRWRPSRLQLNTLVAVWLIFSVLRNLPMAPFAAWHV